MSASRMHQIEAGETRKCRACPIIFTPKRRWQEFCSDRCRKTFHASMTPEAIRRTLDELSARLAETEKENARLLCQVADLARRHAVYAGVVHTPPVHRVTGIRLQPSTIASSSAM